MSTAEPILLASQSAVRARLLAAAGVPVEIERVALDEDEIKHSFRRERRNAVDCARALAEAKALRVAARHPGALVIGADQMLECDGAWFDKPADRAAARASLKALRGKRHRLVCAACVARDGAVLWHVVEQPQLAMRDFSDGFLEDYLAAAGDAVFHSVGAYQLEGLGAQLFSRVEGDYFAILGLPLLPLLAFLRGRGALPA